MPFVRVIPHEFAADLEQGGSPATVHHWRLCLASTASARRWARRGGDKESTLMNILAVLGLVVIVAIVIALWRIKRPPPPPPASWGERQHAARE